MAVNFTLEDIVFQTIHNNPKGISGDDIAARTGTGYNHLMRMANITDVCNMPLSKAVPVMNVTEDYRILHFLAKKTGHLCIKQPRGIRKGTDPKMDIGQYQKEFSELLNLLFDHVDEPTDELLAEIVEKMRKHIGDSVNIKRRCKRHLMHQCELNL